MITSKKTDGTYGEIGFIKVKQEDGSYKDIEYQYNNKGNLIFEKGFTRSKEGTLPLVINGIGKPLKDYDIEGNISQATTPTGDSPQEVKGCGEYDEITGKYKILVASRGKNLFDKGKITTGFRLYPDGTTNSDSASNMYVSDYLPVLPNTEYCQSPSFSPSAAYANRICFYDKDKNFLLNVETAVMVSPENAKYARKTGYISNLTETQLELGSTTTEYSPYVEPITTPIYLDSPLYKIGDYADSRGMTEEVRAIKEVVLTGEESWGNNYNGYTLSTAKKQGLYTVICSHYAPSAVIKEDKTVYTNSTNVLIFYDSSFTTVEDWKSYLAAQYANGTPVKVYYVLATPETKAVEPVEIPTLNGTTVIDVDTEVKPSNMWVEYKSSTSEYNPITLRTANNQVLYTADGEPIRTLQ